MSWPDTSNHVPYDMTLAHEVKIVEKQGEMTGRFFFRMLYNSIAPHGIPSYSNRTLWDAWARYSEHFTSTDERYARLVFMEAWVKGWIDAEDEVIEELEQEGLL
jgi:hypothetical protein